TDGHLIRAYIQFDAERSVAPSVWAASTWRGKPNAPWLIGNVHPCASFLGDGAIVTGTAVYGTYSGWRGLPSAFSATARLTSRWSRRGGTPCCLATSATPSPRR